MSRSSRRGDLWYQLADIAARTPNFGFLLDHEPLLVALHLPCSGVALPGVVGTFRSSPRSAPIGPPLSAVL